MLISSVNPDIRQKVATNILHDYGYFNGTVSYQTFVNPKDSLKAKLQYTVDMRNPYFIDTVYYRGFNSTTMQIINLGRRRSLISPGEQFNVTDLDGERTRISGLLRNMGYYYFRPDYLTYQADTTLVPGGHVSLRLYYKTFWIHYYDKLKIRPNMLHRWLNYQGYQRKRQELDKGGMRRRPEKLYSQYRQTRIQERLASVGIFRYLEMQYTPRDTALVSDTLDVNIRAMLDKPYDAELDFNVTMKSNNQTGPGAAFTVTKNNVFGGGETWNVKVNGSYEWQTGKNSSSLMNSYELGLSSALTFPRIVFPRMGTKEYDFPASTTFRVYIDQMNRAKYYKLLAFGGNVTYDFQPVPTRKHSITPFQLTFNVLRNPTAAFEEIQAQNPALYISLRNQFIPKMEYTYTYDNASLRTVRNPIWWQTTFGSAGNLTSLVYKAFGQSFSKEDKKLLGVPFAQFLKLNSEFRYHYRIDKNQMIASRIAGGFIWSYGNATTAPYTEQFYIGGANSIRAFTVRSIGPGGYHPKDSKYSYLDQTGTFRFEANVEYRFRIFKSIWGATFLDAGNVWLLRKDEARPDSQLRLKTFPKQIALGTGVGVRYDMDILVFRLDFGIPLHLPYDTERSGYYNVTGTFFKNLGIHFAIGYPF